MRIRSILNHGTAGRTPTRPTPRRPDSRISSVPSPVVVPMRSATFGIGFADQGTFFDPPTISRDADDVRRFDSLMVTNTTYAALSMRDGDSFAKKFGGADGNDPDFLLLTITGKNSAGAAIGTVEFYLADYRFADNSLDYIVDDWIQVDLSPIAHARSLEFAVSSSDVGPFGINTPAFFAVDEITLVKPILQIDIADREVTESDGEDATVVRISRSDNDTTAADRRQHCTG